ncbi:MAG: hypothetical protein K2M10_04220 [Muribaculaceae bacterium]|nr:hypothetical protein [Muribaculaceae bacterium]
MNQSTSNIYSLYQGIKNIILVMLMASMGFTEVYSQIGYQVALINNATGEPRAMETVTVDLEITNKEGKTIFSGSQTATTNDFGILSLSVGDSSTFKDLDWSKLPFYISAKADGILIGKTEILSVPIAEYAKNTGVLTIKKLCSQTWVYSDSNYKFSFTFNEDGTGNYNYILYYNGAVERRGDYPLRYYCQGNIVNAISETDSFMLIYIPETNSFSVSDSRIYR